MPLNLQERHQFVAIPAGWSVPKFTFGQIVSWDIPQNLHFKANKAWGQIIEMTFYCGSWQYGVTIAPDCPIAVAHPRTWGVGDLIEILHPEQLTLVDW
jgi:hypothetical protein